MNRPNPDEIKNALCILVALAAFGVILYAASHMKYTV